MWRVHDGMGWWMVFGGLLWLAFWVLIVYMIVSLVIGPRREAEAQPSTPTDTLEIVRRRYAAGEITRDEFQQLRDDLSASRSGTAADDVVSARSSS